MLKKPLPTKKGKEKARMQHGVASGGESEGGEIFDGLAEDDGVSDPLPKVVASRKVVKKQKVKVHLLATHNALTNPRNAHTTFTLMPTGTRITRNTLT
jgi:hypothetical protein